MSSKQRVAGIIAFCVLLTSLAFNSRAAVLYVDLNSTNPVPPFNTWSTAATNIQDAVEAAAAGDSVLVTNGIYSTGGKSMDGIITNRVAIYKRIAVQSVNGPEVTIIEGFWDPVLTNGPASVRCVAITNTASLTGFTLRHGATRANSGAGDSPYGGGVYRIPGKFQIWPHTNVPPVNNCIIIGNAAGGGGAGASGVALNFCVVGGNFVTAPAANPVQGGGAYSCLINGCLITNNACSGFGGAAYNSYTTNTAFVGNSSVIGGAASYRGALINCTVVSNVSFSYPNISNGAVETATLINSIVYNNLATSSGNTNYASDCSFSYCDSHPLPPGTGNVDIDPQVLADGFHLGLGSPCLGIGTNVTVGADFDGQPWQNPPAIGCDEWQPEPVIGPKARLEIGVPYHGLTLGPVVAGQPPFTCFWSKDGTALGSNEHFKISGTNLMITSLGPDDAGFYQVIVSNSFGTVTGKLAQLVVHAVDQASANPVPPFSSWATAATNIQDAIEASAPGDIILVTNGVYASGGKVKDTVLMNRIAIDKIVTVISVNGYADTIIEGAWDPATTNGSQAVRCAWLMDEASLIGFTLRNGATRASVGGVSYDTGGAVLGTSTKATIANCLVTNNAAGNGGGGVAYVSIKNSLLVGNLANSGGGSYFANLYNCTVTGNRVRSLVGGSGGGTYQGQIKNSIVIDNFRPSFAVDNHEGALISSYSYSCTDPLTGLVGTGNTNVYPQFLNSFHLAASSPCRGIGSSLYASGVDSDGELWADAPSIGWDELIISNQVGPLSVTLSATRTNAFIGHFLNFSGTIVGRATQAEWAFDDGLALTNRVAPSHAWSTEGSHSVTFTARNLDNPGGVSTTLPIHISPVDSPQISPVFPQSNGFQFQFPVSGTITYMIQYATNLAAPINWQTLKFVFPSTNGVYLFNDSAETIGSRFYRVIAQ